ncbi:MAG: hypothetical protein INH41_21390 [Myxococcaceae bacterium]|nr:hypothetical protein [Myxococcaceae bacterium]MCA3014949.1 hypothetical protein [Myxococcaceae bacterium]
MRLQTSVVVRAGWLVVALLGTGCVTVYQPLVGLQRPIAIDPAWSNTFDGTRLLVRCHQGDGVEADQLCRNLRSAFSKQGAVVTTEVVRAQARAAPATKPEAGPAFVMDVTSRRVAQRDAFWSTLLCIVSFTLIPQVEEYAFAQDVTVRDGQGFLLAQQTFQERFIESFGVGVWALNAVLDLVVRPKAEKVTGDGYKEEFTTDLHGHLGQLLYNATVRARVMRSFEPEPGRPRAGGDKPTGAAP